MKLLNKPFRVIDVLLIATLALTLLAMTTISGCGVIIRPTARTSVPADEFHGQLERTSPDHVSPNTNLNHIYVIEQPDLGMLYE